MGLGLQGRGVGDTRIFLEAGARVTVTDVRSEKELRSSLKKLEGLPIRFILGRHEKEDFRSHDMVLRNPDVSAQSPFLKIARDAGIPIKMDSSLFARYCPLPIVGVTGTRGKTTTTMMIYEILRKFYRGKVYLGGNIPGKATLELIKEIGGNTEVAPAVHSPLPWSSSTSRGIATAGFGRTSDFSNEKSGPSEELVVLELSSWELQGWRDEKISPHVAVFTNLYEDHLNRYASMEEYFQDKLAILQFQKKTDWAILNTDNSWTKKAAAETNARIKWFSFTDLPRDAMLRVPGEHNRTNAAAALQAASILGVKGKEGLKIVEGFRGVPSRLETIATIDGVDYINDTTSTTPAAGIAALQAIKKPIILIAGGSSKKLNLQPFTEEIIKRAKHVIFLSGEGTDELLSHLKELEVSQTSGIKTKVCETAAKKLIAGVYDDFKIAIFRARELAESGDVVLLSPGCASFSMFTNEFQRGEQFNHIVRQWQKEKTSS